MTEERFPSIEKTNEELDNTKKELDNAKKELDKVKKDITTIQTNDLVHLKDAIEDLSNDIKKLKPRATSFYLGALFIIFIIGISFLYLPLNYGIGISIVCILPLMMCLYAIFRLREQRS